MSSTRSQAGAWVKLAEVARMLGIDRKTLVGMVERGEWPQPRLIGTQRMYKRSWIEHWDRTNAWPEGVTFKPGEGRGRVARPG